MSGIVDVVIHNAVPLVYEFDNQMNKVRNYYIDSSIQEIVTTFTQ